MRAKGFSFSWRRPAASVLKNHEHKLKNPVLALLCPAVQSLKKSEFKKGSWGRGSPYLNVSCRFHIFCLFSTKYVKRKCSCNLSILINFADWLLFAGQEDASPVPARQSGLPLSVEQIRYTDKVRGLKDQADIAWFRPARDGAQCPSLRFRKSTEEQNTR